jgi:hypothetical protein
MAAGGLLIPLLIGAGTAAATAGISALTKPKAATPVVSTPAMTTNPVAQAVRNSDLLRSRQGALANNLTGGTAGTPTPGVRALFGQGG